MRCKQELCANWGGDGNVCPCALFDLGTDATDPLPWDRPDADVLQDIGDAIKRAEDDYEAMLKDELSFPNDLLPPTHPDGPRRLRPLEDLHLKPRLVPKEEAIRQSVEATGLPEEMIRQYADELKKLGAVDPMLSVGAIVAVGNAFGTYTRAAADAEHAGIRADRGRLYYNGTDLTPYIELQYLPAQLPHNPANRRTFHLLGKPHHFIQTEKGLQTRPGESPWE